jgi:hypothetical protein
MTSLLTGHAADLATSSEASHLLSAAGIERPSTLQIRVSGHAVEISRRLRQEGADETDGEWSTTLEPWADTGNLGTFDALRVWGVTVTHPIRVWLDLAGNDDRYTEVAHRFRERVVDRPRTRVS